MYSKAVTKILSSRIYAISRQEIEQLGSSFDSTFILFPMKTGKGQTLSSGGKSMALALNDSPGWSLHYLHIKVFHFNLLYM